jgi:peptidylprolyl isomerase
MHRPLLVLAVAFALAGCGGDDTTTEEPSTTTVPATTEASAEPVTSAPPTEPQECADVPDASRYAEGEIPPAIPPCTVPGVLVIHTIREGTGRAAEAGDTVIVDYVGLTVERGTVFDTSYARGAPLDFPLGRGSVIAGWDEGLVGARAGSLLRLDIPNELAYGDSPPGDEIEPGDALSFYTEVRAVIPPATAADAPLDLDVPPSTGATELTVTDLEVGDGAAIEAGDTAVVHMLLVRGDNQVVLFNTWERDDPLQIVVEDGVTLPGILEGLQGATVGTRRVLAMPPELAFGPDGEPSLGLPAGTDLIVVLDVVGVY